MHCPTPHAGDYDTNTNTIDVMENMFGMVHCKPNHLYNFSPVAAIGNRGYEIVKVVSSVLNHAENFCSPNLGLVITGFLFARRVSVNPSGCGQSPCAEFRWCLRRFP
jgi:hypothetical protein